MTDLDGEEQLLLSRARIGLLPGPGASARVRRGIGGAVAAGASAAANSAFPGPGVRSGASNGLRVAAGGRLGRLPLAATIAGTGVAPSYWFGYRAGRRAGQAAAGARAVSPAPVAVTAPPGWEPPPQFPATAAADARPSHGAIAARAREGMPRVTAASGEVASTESLGKEVTALRAVERALRDGQPALAFALLQRLDHEVPNGTLLEEREATSAIARCALGRLPFGVNLAEDFAARHPDSVYLERVEGTCARRREDQKSLAPSQR